MSGSHARAIHKYLDHAGATLLSKTQIAFHYTHIFPLAEEIVTALHVIWRLHKIGPVVRLKPFLADGFPQIWVDILRGRAQLYSNRMQSRCSVLSELSLSSMVSSPLPSIHVPHRGQERREDNTIAPHLKHRICTTCSCRDGVDIIAPSFSAGVSASSIILGGASIDSG